MGRQLLGPQPGLLGAGRGLAPGALEEGLLPGQLPGGVLGRAGRRPFRSSARRRARRAASSASRACGQARSRGRSRSPALGHDRQGRLELLTDTRAAAFDIVEGGPPLEDRDARRRAHDAQVVDDDARAGDEAPARGQLVAQRERGLQVGHPGAAAEQPRGVPVRVEAQGARQPAAAGGRDRLLQSPARSVRAAAAALGGLAQHEDGRCLGQAAGIGGVEHEACQDVAEGRLDGQPQVRLDLEAVREATAALPGQRAQEMLIDALVDLLTERLLARRKAFGLGPQPVRDLLCPGERRLGLGRGLAGISGLLLGGLLGGIRLLAGAGRGRGARRGLRGGCAGRGHQLLLGPQPSLAVGGPSRGAFDIRRQSRAGGPGQRGALLVGAAGLPQLLGVAATSARRRSAVSRASSAAVSASGSSAAMRWRASSARATAADRSAPMRARSRSSASPSLVGARPGQLDVLDLCTGLVEAGPQALLALGTVRQGPRQPGGASPRPRAGRAGPHQRPGAKMPGPRHDGATPPPRPPAVPAPPRRAPRPAPLRRPCAPPAARPARPGGGPAAAARRGGRARARGWARPRPARASALARRRWCLRMPAASSKSGRRSSGRSARAWSTMPWPMKRKALSARLASSSRSTRSRSRMRWRFRRYSFSPERKRRRESSTSP